MHVLVLGSAAGGGLPQWNCNCENCRLARKHAPNIKPRTQSSLAISQDGGDWFLLNCSPDLRQQVNANRCLWPSRDSRHSPIAGAVLTNGDVDHVAGLLSLRERQPLVIHATQSILDTLDSNSIMNVLDRNHVIRRTIRLDEPFELNGADGPSGIRVEAFAVPGKTPLYREQGNVRLDVESDETTGLEIESDGKKFFYIPACSRMTPELRDRLHGAPLVFWDGTLWQDDEMIRQGLGRKTGRRMGHISMSGESGSLETFEDVEVERRIFIHINNTNPALREDSLEFAAVRNAGWELAHDGMEVRL